MFALSKEIRYSFERAFAVPAVARAVLVPERVVDGARQLLLSKPLVFGFGVG